MQDVMAMTEDQQLSTQALRVAGDLCFMFSERWYVLTCWVYCVQVMSHLVFASVCKDTYCLIRFPT